MDERSATKTQKQRLNLQFLLLPEVFTVLFPTRVSSDKMAYGEVGWLATQLHHCWLCAPYSELQEDRNCILPLCVYLEPCKNELMQVLCSSCVLGRLILYLSSSASGMHSYSCFKRWENWALKKCKKKLSSFKVYMSHAIPHPLPECSQLWS